MRKFLLILLTILCTGIATVSLADKDISITRDTLSVEGCYAYMLQIRNLSDSQLEQLIVSDNGISGYAGSFLWSSNSSVSVLPDGSALVPLLAPAGEEGDSVYLRYECPVNGTVTEAATTTAVSVLKNDHIATYTVRDSLPVSDKGVSPSSSKLPTGEMQDMPVLPFVWITESDGIQLALKFSAKPMNDYQCEAELSLTLPAGYDYSSIKLTAELPQGFSFTSTDFSVSSNTLTCSKAKAGTVLKAILKGIPEKSASNLSIPLHLSLKQGAIARNMGLYVSESILPAAKLETTITPEDWSWSKGTKHTASLLITNIGNADLTEFTVKAADVLCGNRDIGTITFIKQNGSKLKNKLQSSSIMIDKLSPGEYFELTMQWNADVNTASLTEARLHVSFSGLTNGIQITDAADYTVLRSTAQQPSPFELKLFGPVSVGLLISIITGLSILIALMAVIISTKRRHSRKEV